jgi:hypothetical protein
MQSTVAINNRLQSCEPVTVTEGIRVLGQDETNPVQVTTSDIWFRKGFFYAINDFSGGAATANSAAIILGKSATYLPDTLNPGDTILIQAPEGCRIALSSIYIKGSEGDGVFYSLM